MGRIVLCVIVAFLQCGCASLPKAEYTPPAAHGSPYIGGAKVYGDKTGAARDLWAHKNLGVFGDSITCKVAGHQTVLLRLWPVR